MVVAQPELNQLLDDQACCSRAGTPGEYALLMAGATLHHVSCGQQFEPPSLTVVL